MLYIMVSVERTGVIVGWMALEIIVSNFQPAKKNHFSKKSFKPKSSQLSKLRDVMTTMLVRPVPPPVSPFKAAYTFFFDSLYLKLFLFITTVKQRPELVRCCR